MARLPRFSLSSLRRVEYIAVGMMLAFVAIIVALALFAGLDAVIAHLRQISLRVIVLLLALSTVNYLLRAWRWQLFANGLGLAVPWPRNLLYFVSGFALTATPGKAGEALRL